MLKYHKSRYNLQDTFSLFYPPTTFRHQGSTENQVPDVNVTNLTSSFEDGKAILALLNDANAAEAPYRPTSDALLNRKKAYRLAEELYGVPQLLNFQDARVFAYEQVMLTYLVELYNRLPKELDRSVETKICLRALLLSRFRRFIVNVLTVLSHLQRTRTLAMVMIYLKVFSWWRRVKAGRRASASTTPLSQLDQPRFDPQFMLSDPNEYVVLVFVDGVRDLPKSAQIKLLVAECGEDSTETQLSKECSANIILHAARLRRLDRRMWVQTTAMFSARIAMPLPSALRTFLIELNGTRPILDQASSAPLYSS